MTLDASFIVPTHRRPAILELSVPLLLAQAHDPERYEVIVVADGPEVAVRKRMARMAAPHLRFFELSANRGPGAARNSAIAKARGRVLVFVDDDSLVQADFLARHLCHHHPHDNRVVSGPIINVTTAPDMGNPPRVTRLNRHFNPFPTGNASVLKCHVLTAGGFDEAFRHYGWEDPELYARLRQCSLEQRFEFGAPIYHLKPDWHETAFPALIRRELARGANGALFYAKHPELTVGLTTKQHPLFQGIDRLLDGVFNLERRMRSVLDGGTAPSSGTLRKLLLLHAEISGGRAGGG